jgi:leucyl-tRNA synthetase
MSGQYNFQAIEKKWRNYWLDHKTYRTAAPGEEGFVDGKPKCYVLDMFPYPSGSGLHIGHPKGYIASDIYSRFKRMQGYNVLHPMGFDSFGLPAEQYAIEHNVHPAVVTEENINSIRAQLQFLGLGYDWDREIATSRDDYYRWTQWIFIRLYESYYDADHHWQDVNGRPIKGKALPIDKLVQEFAAGQRAYSKNDKHILANVADEGWHELTEKQRQDVLNNYRLAYQDEIMVNWCPGLGTVLANEEVTNDGKSERGNFLVYKRPLKQWIMRITAYTERLLEDLDADMAAANGETFRLDWPPAVKLMQQNWIGRSEGAEVLFEVLRSGTDEVLCQLPVFTTRPDTLFGATFMVVAPQHPLVDPNSDQYNVPESWPAGIDDTWKGNGADIGSELQSYAREADIKAQAGRDEEREKTGIFSGFYALNPVNGHRIPIFVADYVSMDYGAGAIMAVPAHDERDYEFAEKFGLNITTVVDRGSSQGDRCFSGSGTSVNSPTSGDNDFSINGLETSDAKEKIIALLEGRKLGSRAVHYKLRDWIFSRQRYWGEPFPLVTHREGYTQAVEPPVVLPPMEDFRPQTSEDPDQPVQPPLFRAGPQWREVTLDDGSIAERELNVMPQWAGSCWYYLRFIDPLNEGAFCNGEKENYFMPVDLYIGGAEHAVLHLLYSRFWHKVLYDLGFVSTPEPFKKLFNQGMITADAFQDERGVYVDIREVEVRDGEAHNKKTGEKLLRTAGKMGKRFKNGLPPEEIGLEFGVDTLRLYEMYMGPLEASAPWSMEGIRGMQRFLQRVWRNFIDQEGNTKIGGEASSGQLKTMHRTILRVSDHLENLRFNTAISAMIEWNNELVGCELIPEEITKNYLCLLNPLAPHIAEEIWSLAQWGEGQLTREDWPIGDESLTVEDTIILPIQINGKMRGQIEVAVDIEEEDLKAQVLELENVLKFIEDPKRIKRFIVVPGRIVNIVI